MHEVAFDLLNASGLEGLRRDAREIGFIGPIVALIRNRRRRAPMQLAGATAAFTPKHVLAAAIAAREQERCGIRNPCDHRGTNRGPMDRRQAAFAAERAGEVIMDIPPSFVLSEDDSLYICGTLDAFDRFYAEFAQ